jgi:hypothetical protein
MRDGAKRCCTIDLHPAVALILVTPLASMRVPSLALAVFSAL